MDSLSYDQLLQNGVTLPPVPVTITGIDKPLLVHQFTMDQIEAVNEKAKDDDAEKSLRKQVIFFLRGVDCEPTDDDCKKLGGVFSGWQIREIYTKAMKLNGFGPDSLREAEKN
jgi:hypothetical protein